MIHLLRTMICLAALALAYKAEAPSDPWAIVDRAIKQHGGPQKVAKLKSAQIKVTGTLTEPSVGAIPITLTDSWRLPEKYRTENQLEVNGMKMTRVMTLNGDKGWVALNGSFQEMDKASFEELKEQVYAESLDKLFPLLERSRFQLSTLGETEIDAHKAIGVKASAAGHRDVRLYFDEATGLLVKRAEQIKSDAGKDVLREVVFSGHKPVEGVQFPTKIVGYFDGKKVLEGTVTEIKPLAKLDDALFTKP